MTLYHGERRGAIVRAWRMTVMRVQAPLGAGFSHLNDWTLFRCCVFEQGNSPLHVNEYLVGQR